MSLVCVVVNLEDVVVKVLHVYTMCYMSFSMSGSQSRGYYVVVKVLCPWYEWESF